MLTFFWIENMRFLSLRKRGSEHSFTICYPAQGGRKKRKKRIEQVFKQAQKKKKKTFKRQNNEENGSIIVLMNSRVKEEREGERERTGQRMLDHGNIVHLSQREQTNTERKRKHFPSIRSIDSKCLAQICT